MHIQEKSINNTSTLLLNGFCTNTLFSCEPSTKNIIGCLYSLKSITNFLKCSVKLSTSIGENKADFHFA